MAIAEVPRFVRADGPDKVTGSGRYAADINLTGQLVAKFRYAGVSHARITKLDTSAASAMPGVFAVLTAADVPDVIYSPVVPDRRLFAKDVVRFEGELLAAVAAVDAATAQAAVDAIVVEYEDLPIVDDLEAAMADEISSRSPGLGSTPSPATPCSDPTLRPPSLDRKRAMSTP